MLAGCMYICTGSQQDSINGCIEEPNKLDIKFLWYYNQEFNKKAISEGFIGYSRVFRCGGGGVKLVQKDNSTK